jgi:ribosomal-protein-alanine N-acetyltransferase
VLPSDEKLRIETDRLVLEPVLKTHAVEMFSLQLDPALYTFVPHTPLSLEELESRYEKWQTRRSPLGNELWLNWVARRKTDSQVVGHFQAGVELTGDATIAYTVGRQFQKQGYAYESLEAMVRLLGSTLSSETIKAWVDTRNMASIGLLKKLGFSQVLNLPNADFFKGEKSDEYVFELIPSSYLGGSPAV